MNEKITEMLEKLYLEFQDARDEFRREILKVQLDIEHKVMNKIEVLFECNTEISNKLNNVEEKLDSIKEKSNSHDIRIQVIEKTKNNEIGLI